MGGVRWRNREGIVRWGKRGEMGGEEGEGEVVRQMEEGKEGSEVRGTCVHPFSYDPN